MARVEIEFPVFGKEFNPEAASKIASIGGICGTLLLLAGAMTIPAIPALVVVGEFINGLSLWLVGKSFWTQWRGRREKKSEGGHH